MQTEWSSGETHASSESGIEQLGHLWAFWFHYELFSAYTYKEHCLLYSHLTHHQL